MVILNKYSTKEIRYSKIIQSSFDDIYEYQRYPVSDREFGLEVDNNSFSQNIHVTKQNNYRITKGKQNSLPKIILAEKP